MTQDTDSEKYTLKQLIEAFNIFLKYDNPKFPTGCEHDVLYVYDEGQYSLDKISKDDVSRLEELGFEYDDDVPVWESYRYGSG